MTVYRVEIHYKLVSLHHSQGFCERFLKLAYLEHFVKGKPIQFRLLWKSGLISDHLK